MGFIDANGIYKYDSGDSLTPLETLLNLGEQSVSDKFAQIGPGTIRYVANTTARNALAASYAPTATKPLYVYRGDAALGRNLEFTVNGTTWQYVSDSRDDTGWVTVPLAAGFTGPFRLRRVGQVVYASGTVTGPFTASATIYVVAAGGVPADLRPPTELSARLPSGTGGQVDSRGVLQPNGAVIIVNGPVAAVNFNMHPFSGYMLS